MLTSRAVTLPNLNTEQFSTEAKDQTSDTQTHIRSDLGYSSSSLTYANLPQDSVYNIYSIYNIYNTYNIYNIYGIYTLYSMYKIYNMYAIYDIDTTYGIYNISNIYTCTTYTA